MTVAVLARANNIVANNLDCKVELGIRGWGVLEDGKPSCAIAVTNTKVERRVIAPWVSIGTPLASVLDSDTSWVDIVLSRGRATLPLVVLVGVGAGKVVAGACCHVEWNGLALGTCFIVREINWIASIHLPG